MQSYQIQNEVKKAVNSGRKADIVHLKSSDFAIASEHLSAAFSQDPLIGYFLPEDTAAKHECIGTCILSMHITNSSRTSQNLLQPNWQGMPPPLRIAAGQAPGLEKQPV